MYFIDPYERTIFKCRKHWAFNTFEEAKAALLEDLKEELKKMESILAMYIECGYSPDWTYEKKTEIFALEADIRRISDSKENDWSK